MDFLDLLGRLASLDTPAAAPRRSALSRLSNAGTVLLPGLLTALATPAQAGTQNTRTPLDAFKLVLRYENLQAAFYTQALSFQSLFTNAADVLSAVRLIQGQQKQHATALATIISNSGSAQDATPSYDFTGSRNGTQGAQYPDVFTNLNTFLQVAQLLKDASVRVYKGQISFLQADNNLLETAVRLHSTEARHAAHIRTLRRRRGVSVKSWVSPSDAPITGVAADAAYNGEANTTQYVAFNNAVTRVPFDSSLPINVGTPPLSAAAVLAKVAEAFDEPVEASVATDLLRQFTY
ncbi:ferritin-like domain-containing protein [Hymenobacter sp. 102]|uniref:ferritin-like domain-containing protein n=1 Tax=Hymenobacter sp. 102 TaxID=3403152 RepID=UPI003CFBB081